MRTSEQLNDPGIVDTTKSRQQATSTNQQPTRSQSKSKCNSVYEFTCQKSGSCIPIYDVCNTFFDCDDKTDEAECEPLEHRKNSNYENPDAKNQKPKPNKADKTDSILVNDLKGNVVSDPQDKDPKEADEALIEVMRPELKVNSDYDYDSLQLKQAEIIAHLKELEDAENLKSSGRNKQKFKTPEDLFDSFMRTKPNPLKTTTKESKTKKMESTTKKKSAKILWNGKSLC